VIPRACWPGNFVPHFVPPLRFVEAARFRQSLGLSLGLSSEHPLVQAIFRCVCPTAGGAWKIVRVALPFFVLASDRLPGLPPRIHRFTVDP
jgi:hypothetical protein